MRYPKEQIRAFRRAGFGVWALLVGAVALAALVLLVLWAAAAVLCIRARDALGWFWREWLTPSAQELPEYAAALVEDDLECLRQSGRADRAAKTNAAARAWLATWRVRS